MAAIPRQGKTLDRDHLVTKALVVEYIGVFFILYVYFFIFAI